MKFHDVKVFSYSGYKSNERPTGFTFGGATYTISEIVDRWYEGGAEAQKPTLNYFKVKVDDGTEFILRYNSLFDGWSILLKNDDFE